MKICPTCKTKYSTSVFYCPLEGTRLEEDFESGTSKSMIGTILDERYQVVSRLGEGGMGAVYLVEHVTLKKRMAVKVLREEYAGKEDLVKRFQLEAVAASKIGHENIVDVTDFGKTDDGGVYFVMELLDGPNLGDVIKDLNGFPCSRAIHILKQVCSALSAAHKQGIIHRDLKPENIVLVKRGTNTDFVKVLDFGISKMIDTSEGRAEKLTAMGMIVGTPEYMSPEQASGNQVDLRTDIYSLGVIMYEMMTGRLPFAADNALQILSKHINEQPAAPTAVRPDLGIPAPIEALILSCMSKQRESRPQSMDELFDKISAIGGAQEPRGEARHTIAWDSSEVPMPSAMRQAVVQKGLSLPAQQPGSYETSVPPLSGVPGRTSQMPGVQVKPSPGEYVQQVDAARPIPAPVSSVPPAAEVMEPLETAVPDVPQPLVEEKPIELQSIAEQASPQPSAEPDQSVSPAETAPAKEERVELHEVEDMVPGRHGKTKPVLLAIAAVVILAAAAAFFFFRQGGEVNTPTSAPVTENKPVPAPQPPPVVQPQAPIQKAEEPPKPAEEKPAAQPSQQPARKTARIDSVPVATRGSGEVTVDVDSSPSLAEIYKGRDFVGTTPVKLRGARGTQEAYTLKKDGYETLPLNVVYDRTRTVTVELKPSSKPAQQPAKKKEELFHKIEDIKNPFK